MASRLARHVGRGRGGSPRRPAADDANNDGHIGNVQADGVVEDDGDDNDLDEDDNDEG